MRDKICGIVLKMSYPVMGDTSKIELLGKSMLDWVKLSLGDAFVGDTDFSDSIPLPKLVRPLLTDAEITVILFSDTPLITRKTVLDAVAELEAGKENVIKMTRGYCFRTEYLKSAECIIAAEHRFFDEEDFMTAFSLRQAAMICDVLKNRILSYHMSHGVQISDPSTTRISCDVVIGRGCIIHPFNSIGGRTIIKDNVTVLTGCDIENAIIEAGATVEKSVIRDSFVGERAKIGPFAHLRANTKVGEDCRIGNFVEIKNSVLGAGTKAAHHSYIGDAELGKGCNIGCGTVFCNYDGQKKHRSRVGDGVFIGSNANLVAPISIGDGAFIAAGSTITDNVPPQNLAIARQKQTNKDKWKKD